MRPRLLFVTHFLPYPVYSGAASRTLNVLLELARAFDVRVLPYFRRPQHATTDEARAGVEAMRGMGLDVADALPVPADWSRVRGLAVHPSSALLARPFGAVRLAGRAFGDRLRTELTRGADLIHLDTAELAGHLPSSVGVPVVCNYHDVESPALARRAENAPNPALRWYLRQQAGLYEALERRHAPAFALNVVCSEKEKRHLERIAPGATVKVIPNGVDTAYFAPVSGVPTPNSVVFVGGLDIGPNHDGMLWFLESVWPLVLERVPEVTLGVVGRAPENRVASLPQQRGIHYAGRVEDVRPWMARAACVIVPLRLGGATRLKIVHAWGMAKAIVSTAVGCEGLTARDGENILVRDDAEGFAAGIATVLHDAALRDRLGAAGRATAVERYGWDVIGPDIRASYEALL